LGREVLKTPHGKNTCIIYLNNVKLQANAQVLFSRTGKSFQTVGVLDPYISSLNGPLVKCSASKTTDLKADIDSITLSFSRFKCYFKKIWNNKIKLNIFHAQQKGYIWYFCHPLGYQSDPNK